MSSFAAIGANAYGLYQAITGAPQLVQFLDKRGNTIVQFDAVMSESYGHDAKPTTYPIESGSTISDHVIRSPFTLDITGVVSDSPISGLESMARQAFTSSISAVLPQLGVVGVAAAYATYRAHHKSTSPSLSAYAALLKLMFGNPDSKPPVPPEPFAVMTQMVYFESMLLTTLTVPRDPDLGGALVFQCKLTKLEVVATQTVSVTDTDQPGLASMRESVGEKQGEGLSDKFTPGRIAGNASVGNKIGG